MIKRFIEWIGLKEKLSTTEHRPPLVSEGDLWWVSFGENVGSEINGKSKQFSRPGLVLKKLTKGFYLIAPTTSQQRGGAWYTYINLNGKITYVCLHQIRVIDYRRLWSRLGQIGNDDFKRAKRTFLDLYK